MRPGHPTLDCAPVEPDRRAGPVAAGAGDTPQSPAPGGTLSLAAALSPTEALRRAHAAQGARIARRARRVFRVAVAGFGVALLVQVAAVELVAVPADTMAPALQRGDLVIVDKTAYGWSVASLPDPLHRLRMARAVVGDADASAPTLTRLWPRPTRRGDIILYRSETAGASPKVGRVLAVAGDRIAIRRGRVWLNGALLPCEPAGQGLCREGLGGQHWLVRREDGLEVAETQVPTGHQFILGDHRGAAARLPDGKAATGLGLVPDGRIVGRVQHVADRAPSGPGASGLGAQR